MTLIKHSAIIRSFLLCSSFSLLAFSCSLQDDKLGHALCLAGQNRPELEKVLDHYADTPPDSLKLQAARFLIENMPGHYTLAGGEVDSLQKKIDNTTAESYYFRKVLNIAIGNLDFLANSTYPEYDLQHIKADFLIHHIDRIFEYREQLPWLRELPRDIFFEYVLPYRFKHERLDTWIDSLRIDPQHLQCALEADNTRYTLWNTRLALALDSRPFSTAHPLIEEVLRQPLQSDCRNLAVKDHFQGRLSMLPVAIDFFPHYANRNGYHYWVTAISPDMRKIDIPGVLERRAAKVFREMFSIQPHVVPPKGEYVPDFFRNPHYKDVTDEYFRTADVRVRPLREVRKPTRYAYLCSFCNLYWETSAIGEWTSQGIEFTKMGRNIVYLPAYFRLTKLTPLNYPFVLSAAGEIHYLIPDTTRLLDVRLERKYPTKENLIQYAKNLIPTEVDAFNTPDAPHTDTITKTFSRHKACLDFSMHSARAYRYWRIKLPFGIECAEVAFYDNQGRLVPAQTDEKFAALRDGDPLTNQPSSYSKTERITVDFGRPVAVSRVVLLPRSDGNGIYPGDEYELFYHGLDGWRSLGRRVATDYFLDYDNLPAGALYWLHNHTRGVEERPFTITPSGDIRFW